MSFNMEKEITPDLWLAAMDIVVTKPHSVDKRLAGQETVDSFEYELSLKDGFLCGFNFKDLKYSDEEDIVKGISEKFSEFHSVNGSRVNILLQKLILRKEHSESYYQLVLRHENIVQFIPLNAASSEMYQIELHKADLKVDTNECDIINSDCDNFKIIGRVSENCSPRQVDWIKQRLIPRVIGWARSGINTSPSGKQVESVHLIGLEAYCQEYSRLKQKYAGNIINNWRESSDPEKFVHEDIGIAAYILLLWKKQRLNNNWSDDRKQTFVDLGCGNGLLVYILTLEGHDGVGYDIRRRNIWSWYPETIKLEEKSIVPGLDVRFPEADWILGNHSDELTPWIPVLAALSGPKTCFWVLPCCPFNFTSKYQRKSANNSVYRDFLEWLLDICHQECQ